MYTYTTTLTLILWDSAFGEFQLNFASEDCPKLLVLAPKSGLKRVDATYLWVRESSMAWMPELTIYSADETKPALPIPRPRRRTTHWTMQTNETEKMAPGPLSHQYSCARKV